MGNSSSLPRRVRRRRQEEQALSELLCTKPSGLYPTCSWDPKYVRRLIIRGELAPRFPGRDEPTLDAREECPICMLVYPVLNETRCCTARLCTECYLQIRPPRHNKEPCPFCKYKRVEAAYNGPRDLKDIERENMDEKRALEAMKKANLTAAQFPSVTSNSDTNSSNQHQLTTSPTTPNDLHHHQPSDTTRQPTTAPPCPSSQAASPANPHEPCTCTEQTHSTCQEDHRARYVHADQASVVDPIVLEAMAPEAYSNSALERGSASSSAVLDSHAKNLRNARLPTTPGAESARSSPKAVLLPWYGAETHFESAGPSFSAPNNEPAEHDYHEDKVSLNEAIRRSVIEM